MYLLTVWFCYSCLNLKLSKCKIKTVDNFGLKKKYAYIIIILKFTANLKSIKFLLLLISQILHFCANFFSEVIIISDDV